MLSFRQKILISYLTIFFVFTTLLYPIVTVVIKKIQEKNLQTRTLELVTNIQNAPNFSNLIERLRQKEKFLFFRVSLLDPKKGNLFDSHRSIGGGKFDEENHLEQPEVEQAMMSGKGYSVRFSPLFGQEMAYLAITFHYQGETFIMRTAFPYGQISTLTDDFTITFLLLIIGILLLFGLFTWSIIHYLVRPVQLIINAIKPYQLGKEDRIPEIKIARGMGEKDELTHLAETLNSLSKRIDQQINSLVQEKNNKAAILESLGEGVIAVDSLMTVTYVNHMAEIFLGINKEGILGKSFSLAKQPQCHELIHEAQRKGEPASFIFKPEGKPRRYIDAIAVPRGTDGAILVLQDRTSFHKVIELGRDFIANASHELKTPITIIRGFAETLHDHPELSKEVSQEITEKIVTNCQRMDTLVKNLLTLAAVDEGLPRSRLQECDMLDLAEQARQTVLAIHPQAQIQIEIQGNEPVILMGDSDLILQAIINLLDNAIKYSKPPANVKILLEKTEKEAVIKVSDKGIGIPVEDLDRIFERFYAVDKSRSRSLGGTGLGLSIVEGIMEKHQGKIDVESTLGKGTTFILSFPAGEEERSE
jgi:two-component system, OmpR family, phosphate regulon sensor histidine kinase PhoR